MTNRLILEGELVKPPKLTRSPAGVPHLHLVIEHRSMQQEAGLNRKCYARIQAVASGDWVVPWSESLTLGSALEVTGFIQRHEGANGIAKLVLHAQNLRKV